MRERLTPEQEAELLAVVKRSEPDSAEYIAARNRLVTANLGMVWMFANRERYRRGMPEEDAFQAGTMGLMLAIERFDPAREVKLMTFAGHHIRWFIQKESRRYRATGVHCEYSHRDATDNRHCSIAATEAADLVLPQVARLPLKMKQAISGKYGLNGWTQNSQDEIATKLGTTHQAVSQNQKGAMRVLRKRLEATA